MDAELIDGGTHADARGVLRFCNGFDMGEVRRFYTIANSVEQPVRGWIGHRRETKWFFPLKGVTRIVVESMAAGEGADGVRQAYLLDAQAPQVLKVPGGNWFCIEQDGDAEVQVFSNCRVGEFPNDDFRKDYHEEA